LAGKRAKMSKAQAVAKYREKILKRRERGENPQRAQRKTTDFRKLRHAIFRNLATILRAAARGVPLCVLCETSALSAF
jgi:hypothetical protein